MAQQAQGGYDPYKAMNNPNKGKDDVQYQWKFDLNFDLDNNAILMKVQEELSGRKWTKTLTKDDVNGDIREEYKRLGEAISNGEADYIYPVDSGALKCTIKYKNQELFYSIPQDY